jgi:hypothetical protein
MKILAKMSGRHVAVRMENGRLKDRQKAERQIERLQERNSRSASLFTVTVEKKRDYGGIKWS